MAKPKSNVHATRIKAEILGKCLPDGHFTQVLYAPNAACASRQAKFPASRREQSLQHCALVFSDVFFTDTPANKRNTMNTRETPGFGVLLVQRDGKPVFASGIASDPALQAQLLAKLADRREQDAGILAIEAATPAVATFRVLGETTVFLAAPAAQGSALFEFVASVDFADAILNQILESPYSGMLVVDQAARLRYIAPAHREFFKLKPGEGLGRPISEVIPDAKLPEVLKSGRAEFGKLWASGNVSRVVSRIPVRRGGEVLGAMGQVMFKAPEHVHLLSQEVTRLRKEVDFYRKELSGAPQSDSQFEQMVGNSDALRQLKSDLLKVAPLQVPVLIVGESGTGKELAAQAIHALSPRSQSRMVIVNAAAIPGSLVEAELFGYESGSFTGAEKGGRRGKFELANNSSLFFDEMGDMPPEIQVKLLRVLQDGMFERVGGQRATHSDFRLISASNRNFEELVAKGQFRLDLYYRISGVTVRMPSLRERLEDIPLMVERFLVNFARRHGASVKGVDRRVYDFLREHSWPGNVRQLLHEVEKAAIFCDGPEITVENFRLLGHLPAAQAVVQAAQESREAVPEAAVVPAEPTPAAALAEAAGAHAAAGAASEGEYRRMQDAIEALEKNMIQQAMVRHRGNKKKVAEELGISRAYLYKKLAIE